MPVNNQFKLIVYEQLLIAAKSYSKMVGRTVFLLSNNFIVQKRYILKFNKDNFLHLTGVSTDLRPIDFYDKCILSTISLNEFSYNDVKSKSTIKQKLRNLVTIDQFFKQKLLVQEQFVKNRVICRIATADNKCTIGFNGAKNFLYPCSLLDKNHLDCNKPIIDIQPIIK